METKALKVPTYFAELCLQAFTARQDLIDWIKELMENNVSKKKYSILSKLNKCESIYYL